MRYFGPGTKTVGYVPLVFECTGGFGPTAVEEFAGWAKEAAEKVRKAGGRNYRATGLPHTWNAMKFASMYSQMISFVICESLCLVDPAGCGESPTTRRGSGAAKRDLKTVV